METIVIILWILMGASVGVNVVLYNHVKALRRSYARTMLNAAMMGCVAGVLFGGLVTKLKAFKKR